jgi:hypothetical protein
MNWFWKIIEKIAQVPKDKLLHEHLAMDITFIAIVLFKFLGTGKIACGYGWGVGVIALFLKEILDECREKDSSDAYDYAVGLIGVTFVSLMSLLLML